MCASFAGDTRTSSNGCQVAKRIMRENARHPLDSRRTTKNIAAIDFGTAFCSVAYSTQDNGENVTMLALDTGSEREPTAILFDKEGKCHSFGQEARDNIFYADDANRIDFDFFEQIKMNLQDDKDVNRDMKITSSSGKVFFLIDVIAHILNYLKNVLLDRLEDANLQLLATDFHWVITVPAIWQARGKQLMREAGYKAGLCSKHVIGNLKQLEQPSVKVQHPESLSLAFEPESAAIFCQNRLQTRLQAQSIIDKPEAYMVVDVGGGTTDISTYKLMDEAGEPYLDVICKPSGGVCGGNSVNTEFEKYLDHHLQSRQFSTFLSVCGDAKSQAKRKQIMRNLIQEKFEKQKVFFGTNNLKSHYTVYLPPAFVDVYREELKQASNDPTVDFQVVEGQQLRLSTSIMRSFFESVIKKIVECISADLKSIRGRMDRIYLVGGFGGCPYVRNRIETLVRESVKSLTQHTKFVTPESNADAVVRGAVLYGARPDIIYARRSDATYGINTCMRFEHTIHEKSYKIFDEANEEYCTNLFSTIIEVGDVIRHEEVFRVSVFPLYHNQEGVSVKVFVSQDKDIWYTTGKRGVNSKVATDNNVQHIGNMDVDMPDLKGDKSRQVEVTFDFSSTEIKVSGYDCTSKTKVNVVMDFLYV